MSSVSVQSLDRFDRVCLCVVVVVVFGTGGRVSRGPLPFYVVLLVIVGGE